MFEWPWRLKCLKLIYDIKTGRVIVSLGRGLGGEGYVGFGIYFERGFSYIGVETHQKSSNGTQYMCILPYIKVNKNVIKYWNLVDNIHTGLNWTALRLQLTLKCIREII